MVCMFSHRSAEGLRSKGPVLSCPQHFKMMPLIRLARQRGKCCCRKVNCPGDDSSPLVMAEKHICVQGDGPDGLPVLTELAHVLILQT